MNWLILYSCHMVKGGRNGEKQIKEENFIEKRLRGLLEKTIATIQKEHVNEYGNSELYFVTYLFDDTRCGLVLIVNSNPTNTLNDNIPNIQGCDYTLLVKSILPCYPNEPFEAELSTGNIAIKFSEHMSMCESHERIPDDIVNYMLRVSQKETVYDNDFYTIEFDYRSVSFIGENGVIYEQRVDNGIYIIDLDSGKIY